MQKLAQCSVQGLAFFFPLAAMVLFSLLTVHSAQAGQDVTRGKILIANEALNDPNFDGAVVLIVGHGNLGTLGLIINRPTVDNSTYFGGPVKVAGRRALAASRFTIPGAIHIDKALYFLDNEEAFEYLRENQHTNAIRSVRAYSGISSWIPGQLQAEINAGAWYVRDSTEEMVFSDNRSLWEELISEIHSQWVQTSRITKSVREVLHPTYNASGVRRLADIVETYGHE